VFEASTPIILVAYIRSGFSFELRASYIFSFS
jgi:hypothetical protein